MAMQLSRLRLHSWSQKVSLAWLEFDESTGLMLRLIYRLSLLPGWGGEGKLGQSKLKVPSPVQISIFGVNWGPNPSLTGVGVTGRSSKNVRWVEDQPRIWDSWSWVIDQPGAWDDIRSTRRMWRLINLPWARKQPGEIGVQWNWDETAVVDSCVSTGNFAKWSSYLRLPVKLCRFLCGSSFLLFFAMQMGHFFLYCATFMNY